MRLINLANFQQFTAINALSDPGVIAGPIVIPFLTQVNVTWNIAGGKTAHNILYGRSAGVPAPSVSQAQSIFAGLTSGAQWTAYASHLASTGASLASVTLTSVHSAGLPSFTSTGSAVPGSNAAIAMPTEMALCVTLRTNGRGTSNRGRMYLTGFTVDQAVTGNLVSASLVTDAAAWANNIKTVLSAQGLTWVIANPARAAYTGSTGTEHPARPAGSVDVQSAVVRDNHWDSQRRRGLK